MKNKIMQFIINNEGQAFVEAVIWSMLVLIFLSYGLVQIGLIQISRIRTEMANYYLGYNSGATRNSSGLVHRTRDLLAKGAPSIYENAGWISRVSPRVKNDGYSKYRGKRTKVFVDLHLTEIMKKTIGRNSSTFPVHSHKIKILRPDRCR